MTDPMQDRLVAALGRVAFAFEAAGVPRLDVAAAAVGWGVAEATATAHGPELAAALRRLAARIEGGDLAIVPPAGCA